MINHAKEAAHAVSRLALGQLRPLARRGVKTLTRLLVTVAVLAGIGLVCWRTPALRSRVQRLSVALESRVDRVAALEDKMQEAINRSNALLQTLERAERLSDKKLYHDVVPVHAVALPGKPAEVRPLPYPFHTYLTINSDPDSMSVRESLKIHEVVHEKYHLNIGDQVFIHHASSDKAENGLLDFRMKEDEAEPVDWARFHRFLVSYNRGWIDGIHGWSSGARASEDTAFELGGDSGSLEKDVALSWKAHDPRDENYVIFEYRLPAFGSRCEVLAGDRPLTVRMTHLPTESLSNAIAWTPAFAQLPPGDPCSLKFVLRGDKARLEVRNLMVVNFCRPRAQAEGAFLRKHQAGFLFYTEHGRHRHELSMGTRYNLEGTTRSQILADSPREAFNAYYLDELDRMGVQFLTAMHHCYQNETIPIGRAVTAHRFNDGLVRFNLPRFTDYPRLPNGTPHIPKTNNQAEQWLGFQIDKLMARSVQLGDGGNVYTHWGCDNPDDAGLSPSTQQRLAKLQDAYYNLSGKRKHWERVWVAPVSEVCLLSRALQGVQKNASYERSSNTVHIRTWLDPVSKQTIPAAGTRAFGLGNLTFYVDDSATAQVRIDNHEHTALKRNPPDHTGRASVTIVDDSVPTTVFDEVDLFQRFGEPWTEQAECYYRSADAFRGAHCLEMQLTAPEGWVEWSLPALTSANTTFLRFAYKKTNPRAKVKVRVKLKDGGEVVATEGALKDESGWTMTPAPAGQWRDVVLDYADLKHAATPGSVPRGSVASVRFEMTDAAAGDQVFFDAVEFLRHPVHPADPEGLVLLAGRTEPAEDGLEVVLEVDQKKLHTKTKAGYFFFPGKATKDSIVQIYAIAKDGARRYPTAGRFFEARRNEVELLIPLADARDVSTSKVEKRVNIGGWELDATGAMLYKPKTLLINSGIGKIQEFQNKVQISNLGFLDRDRRIDNPDGARRLVLFGNCNLFGHSTVQCNHPNIVLEGMLQQRFGYRFEAPALSCTGSTYGNYYPYIRSFAKKMKPDIVCFFIQSGEEILECEPEMMAKFHEYDPAHPQYHIFRSRPDGTLEPMEADPEFFRYAGQDPKVKADRAAALAKGNPYLIDGIDWITVFHRDGELPPAAAKLWDHFRRLTALYRDEFKSEGTRMMLVVTPEVQIRYLGNRDKWVDMHGKTCRLSKFPQRLAAMCRELGIGFVDASQHIRQRYPDPAMCSWRHDNHQSPYGFEWVAECVTDYLARSKFLHDVQGNDPLELN